MRSRLALGGLFFALCAGAWQPARAAPMARFDRNVNGDFLIIGATMGYDCGSGVGAPPNTLTPCPGLFEEDTAADLVWVDNDGSSAEATAARTSAQLALPVDATLVHAQLYWGGLVGGTNGDDDVLVDRNTGLVSTVIADEVQELPGPGGLLGTTAYQSTADVTELVRGMGAGPYRVTGIDARRLLTADDEVFSGWVLVVVYERPGAALRRISLQDGLSEVVAGNGVESRVANLAGLRSPTSAVLAVWAFEGDDTQSGDRVLVEGIPLDGTVSNPSNNFFNSSRSAMGVPVAGLEPEVSGAPNTLAGVDIDVVDVSDMLSSNAGDLDVDAVTTADSFWLGGFVASLALVPPPPDAGPDRGGGGPDAGPGPDGGALDGPGGGGDAGGADPDGGVASDGRPEDADSASRPFPTDARPGGPGDGGPGSNLDGGVIRTVLSGSGCACRTGASSAGSAGPGLLLALGLGALVRRRRRQRLGGGPDR